MRKILIENIKGNEILAKSIYSNLDTILMPQGTKIKKEYVEKLKNLSIESIYVEDDISQGIKIEEITENYIKDHCQKIIAKTIDRYTYSGNMEKEDIKTIITEIMDDILKQPEVIFNVAGVRQKNEETYSHCLNVCALSILISLRMKLPRRKIYEIATGSIIHDIGYINVNIENRRDYDLYSEKEKKKLQMHVIYGYSDIENEGWIKSASKDIVLLHHERLDGKGYPMKLRGDKIGIGVRIVSVCDTFDNLVYGHYTKPMKVHEAIEYIGSLSGQKYDSDVVKIFNKSVAAYPVGSIVVTNENEKAIILKQNYKFPTRPVIRILKDKDGNEMKNWVEKDLIEELNLFIYDTLEDL